MIKRIFQLLFCVLLMSNLYGQGDDQKLRMVISEWKPYKGEALLNNGLISDIARHAFIRAGYRLNTVSVPWKRALSATIGGDYDIIPAIWKTPERSKNLAFSDVLLNSRVVVITLTSNPFVFNKLEDLTGMTVGVGRGWGYPEEFLSADYFTRESVVNLEANIRKLLYGRLSVIVGEELAARYTVNHSFKKSEELIKYSEVSIQQAGLRVAVSRKLPGYDLVLKKFNRALKEMREEGMINSILKSHGISAPAQIKSGITP